MATAINMTGIVPDTIKAVMVMSTAAVPSTLAITSELPDIERYGIAGVCMIAAVISFRMWQNTAKEVQRLHKETVARLESDLQRARDSKK